MAKTPQKTYDELKSKKDISPSVHQWIAIGLLVFIPILFLFPLAFDGKTFPASDTQQWMGTAKTLMDYTEKTGEVALWTPNVFSGMPGYMISFPVNIPGLDWVISKLLKYVLDWRIWYLIFMGLGAYYLARFFQVEPYLAALAGVAFQLSTYFIIILKVGHNTKFQAIAFMPWLILAFLQLMKTLDWKWSVLFAILLSLQLRANHPQITYYTLIALFIIGLFWFIEKVKAKDFSSLKLGIGFSFGSILLAVMTIAIPYLVNYEYSSFTIRGGTLASGTAGLSTGYALAWSFDWLESLTLFIPDFYGGHTPFYWGQMSFTEGPQYLGGMLLCLSLLTFLTPRSRTVISLWVVSVVVLLFSMGSNFSILSELLLKYLPMYNKFRTPSMILVVLSVTIPLLAVIGTKNFVDHITSEKNPSELWKKFYILFGSILGFSILLLLLSGTQSFVKPDDLQRYNQETLNYLKNERAGLYSASIGRFFFVTLISGVLIWLVGKEKVGKMLFGFGLMLIMTLDLWSYNKQYTDGLVSTRQFTAKFNPTPTDQFLLNDKDNYRVFPIGPLFQDTRFNYYHQSLGGYHGAKLANFQNLLDSALYAGKNAMLPLNSGVMKAFGVKYSILNQLVNQELGVIRPVNFDEANKLTTFRNLNYSGKAFFVKNIEVVSSISETIKKMNEENWDPQIVSFINKNITEVIAYDSTATVALKKFSPHEITYQVRTDVNGFLFISEIYYPAGWKAYLNGNELEIYETNHAFRGLIIPSGSHEVSMKYEPSSVALGKTISWVGTIILYGLGIFSLIFIFRKRND